MENSLRNLQIQKMTPQAIHSLQLMTMPLGALLSYVGRCTSENPFVEMNYDWMERSAGIAAAGGPMRGSAGASRSTRPTPPRRRGRACTTF